MNKSIERKKTMFGLKWFGPKVVSGSGIGPRTWQAWTVVAIYFIAVFGVVPALHVEPTVRHQIGGIATGLFLAIALLTYKAD